MLYIWQSILGYVHLETLSIMVYKQISLIHTALRQPEMSVSVKMQCRRYCSSSRVSITTRSISEQSGNGRAGQAASERRTSSE